MHSVARLFVGNLPDNTNEKDLHAAFSSFGDITNLDLKSKPAEDNNKKSFAFVTLSAPNNDVDSCIKHFTCEDFNGKRLYVTRARESFLERLQRERDQAKRIEAEKNLNISLPKENPVINLGDKLNPRKRKIEHNERANEIIHIKEHKFTKDRHEKYFISELPPGDGQEVPQAPSEIDKRKQDSDKKRMEAMKKKRQEFREKQMIIKTGLISVDKVHNKRVIFSDNDDGEIPQRSIASEPYSHARNKNKVNGVQNNKNKLFDEEDSGDEVNFEIKKQFEGKQGQKVLDLQSRYKSDKRFVLDERFVEEDQAEGENNEGSNVEHEDVDVGQTDEKAKQLNILQDLLGVKIKSSLTVDGNHKRPKSMGMLRFDPSQPEHAKFLAPVEEKQDLSKKSKKKKYKEKQEEVSNTDVQEQDGPKVEVSKEQFYKVSETLKEAIAQPTSFSLRSLFGQPEEAAKDETEQDTGFIPLSAARDKKSRHPLDRGDNNPFVYDSSDSESDEKDDDMKQDPLPEKTEVKAVWKENLFFAANDYRFKEGLEFFNKTNANEVQKERRQLKHLVKKRIHNKESKNQMFQKKIGGRKKMMKKSYRKKS